MNSGFHNYSLDKAAVPASQVQQSLDQMYKYGFTAEQVLSGPQIDPSGLGHGNHRFTYRQRIRVLSNMLQLMADHGFWLDTRRTVAISDYGLLGYAMMSSATLEQAIQIAVRYHRMAGAMFELTFLVQGDEAVLRVEHLLPTGDVAQLVVEELFQSMAPLISLLIGTDHRPSSIRLNYASQVPLARYRAAFDCAVEFNQPFCEYRFDAAFLALPLAEADADTARICEESCRSLLDQMVIQEDIVSRISHQILRTPGEFPGLEVVAQRLSIGARTLRRRLKALGTSYQKILDDVKKELAIEYLQTTNLSVQEIADLLGYTEVTNFRRAFMKWVELSPYQYRKNLMPSL